MNEHLSKMTYSKCKMTERGDDELGAAARRIRGVGQRRMKAGHARACGSVGRMRSVGVGWMDRSVGWLV
jgi:hypothetical protein